MSNEYLSIDLETTGLDFDECQILEVAAILDSIDEPLENAPVFHAIVDFTDEFITGQPYALQMNAELLKLIAMKDKHPDLLFLPLHKLAESFGAWLKLNSEETSFTPAGKNFSSFDRNFLQRLPSWSRHVKLRHRSIDVGELYWQPEIDGFKLPDSDTCRQRAGLPGATSHRALDDAMDVCKMIRIHPKTASLFHAWRN